MERIQKTGEQLGVFVVIQVRENDSLNWVVVDRWREVNQSRI